MSTGSLCTGYGGLDRAADDALGHRPTRWHAEIDPAAAPMLDRHGPNLGDITTVDWSRVHPVTRLVAGPPCQPVSVAGRRQAGTDSRWLWPATRTALAALRPDEFVFENVPHLVSIGGGALWAGMLADLTGLGYAVRWCILGACTTGAPHHRHRVFLLARRSPDPDTARVDMPACGALPSTGPVLLPTPTARDGRGGATLDPWTLRQAPGQCLDATVIQLPAFSSQPAYVCAARDPVETRWGRFAGPVARWVDLHGPVPDPVEPGSRGNSVRMRAALPEWMMGLPPGFLTDRATRRDAIRLAGNGVMPRQAVAAFCALDSVKTAAVQR